MLEPTHLDYARRIYAASEGATEPLALSNRLRSSVERVAVIVSAARSGSSFLFDALSRTGFFLAPASEHTPFYKLAGLSAEELNLGSDDVDDGTRDRIRPDAFDKFYSILAREICSGPLERSIEKADLVQRMIRRFAIQWPALLVSYERLFNIFANVIDRHWSCERPFDLKKAYFSALKSIGEQFERELMFAYYDIPSMNSESVDKVGLPPPDERYVIEEPPFIIPRYGYTSQSRKGHYEVFLLKASIDAYYFNILRAVFPLADFKVIFLSRNPASAVNGLLDGWTKGTFFSHRLGSQAILNIKDYSYLGAYARTWWKFELPPKWKNVVNSSLTEVCSYQWKCANSKILNDIEPHQKHVLRVRYEDLVKDESSFSCTFGRILEFLEVDHGYINQFGLKDIPRHMATSRKLFFRWKERESAIQEALAQAGVQEISDALNYRLSEMSVEWI